MKVLHLATGFPLSYPGGITNYVVALAEAQIATGVEVHALVGPDSKAELLPPKLVLHEFESKRIPPFTMKWADEDPDSEQVRQLIRQGGFSLIHVHMDFGFSGRLLDWIAATGIPYLVSLHDYSHICPRIYMIDWQGNLCRRVDLNKCARCVGSLDQVHLLMRLQRRFRVTLPRIPSKVPKRRMETIRRFLGNASLLLPVSERVKEIYSDIVPEARYRTVQIGNKSALNRDYSKTPSPHMRAVFIGTLDKKKGAEVLARLLQGCQRDDLRFVFHGRADRVWGARLQELGVELRGAYTPGDLPEIMRNADIGLVLPTWEDNGPQVVMEFINHGTPLLGTRMGGIPDFVREGTGYLFDPYSESETQGAIDFLNNLDRPQLQKMMDAIRPLKTPAEHTIEMAAIYQQVGAANGLLPDGAWRDAGAA